MILAIKDLAVSSGSACTSTSLEPSYILRSIGLDEALAHTSIRFGIGRFTTEEEIDYTVELLLSKINKLRELSPLWEMCGDVHHRHFCRAKQVQRGGFEKACHRSKQKRSAAHP